MVDSDSWWGDDFDVRFYLISKLQTIKNKKILDVGSGIGVINSELDNSNFRINVDLLIKDLKTCHEKIDKEIQNICASMTHLPFKENSIDVIICSNVLEEAKKNDLKNQKFIEDKNIRVYPSMDKTLSEMSRIILQNGITFITTPNNAYYKTIKLSFKELKSSVQKHFSNSHFFFYNIHHKIGKNRKLNMANVIPRISSKFTNPDKIIKDLVKESSVNNYSVSFFVQSKKSF